MLIIVLTRIMTMRFGFRDEKLMRLRPFPFGCIMQNSKINAYILTRLRLCGTAGEDTSDANSQKAVLWIRIRKFWLDPNPKKSWNTDPDTVV
jgi:hypothetical protein